MMGRRARGHWFRELPSTWESAPLKWLSSIYAGGTPDRSNLDFWTDGTIPWLNSGSVNQQPVVEPSEFITQAGFDASSTRWVPKGALVMALAGQGKTKGMVSQLALTATVNQSMAAIIPERRVLARYLYWWLQSNYRNVRGMGGGELRDGLNLEMLGDIVCPLPPTQRQRDIATFLDRETAEIDAVIAKQEELIGLLGERRSAVTAHAVTKGLNSQAPMTDSGVGWLGEVPAHWEVARSRFLVDISTGSGDTVDADEDGTYPFFVRSDNVERSTTYEFDCEAVLTAGDGAGVGKVYHHYKGRFAAHQRVYVFNNFGHVRGYFFYLYMSVLFGRVTLGGTAKSTVESLRRPMLANFQVTVPPASEQEEIVRYVKERVSEIDNLHAKASESITLMRERRGALISDAVTGRLDIESYGRGRPEEGVA